MERNEAAVGSIDCSGADIAKVRMLLGTSGTSMRGICKVMIMGTACPASASSIDSVTFAGATIAYDLVKDTSVNVSLPTASISPTGCFTTTWKLHKTAGDSDLSATEPSVYTISSPNLVINLTPSDYAMRKSKFG